MIKVFVLSEGEYFNRQVVGVYANKVCVEEGKIKFTKEQRELLLPQCEDLKDFEEKFGGLQFMVKEYQLIG